MGRQNVAGAMRTLQPRVLQSERARGREGLGMTRQLGFHPRLSIILLMSQGPRQQQRDGVTG